jgi:hypothetical protein
MAILDTLTPTQHLIVGEVSDALHRIGAPKELCAAVGSWCDTLSEPAVLDALRRFNAGLPAMDKVWASTAEPEDGDDADVRQPS